MAAKGIFPPPELHINSDWAWHDNHLGTRITTWFAVQIPHSEWVLFNVDYGEWGHKDLTASTRVRWIEASDRFKRLSDEEQATYE